MKNLHAKEKNHEKERIMKKFPEKEKNHGKERIIKKFHEKRKIMKREQSKGNYPLKNIICCLHETVELL